MRRCDCSPTSIRRGSRQDSPPTILTALDAAMGSDVPVTLTAWDAGFLRGLYATSINRRTATQRAEIAGKISEGLGAPGR